MTIKFAEVDVNKDQIKKDVLECLENNWVTSGSKVKELEKNFAEIFKYKYVACVNSGTTADLLAALSLYDIAGAVPRESEVIVPALGFISAINSFWLSNLNLVFCDVKRETLNIDESKIEQYITDKTKAILAINTMGRPCKMDSLRLICNNHNLILISDNCEGHLCKYKNKYMGEWADIVTYSGYSAHLVFSVEQGWIGTNRKDVYESVIANRTHGREHGNLLFEHKSIGWNGKSTDLHAVVGLNSLKEILTTLDKRNTNLAFLLHELKCLQKEFYFSPESTTDYTCCPHALSLTFTTNDENRFNRFCGYLQGKDIEFKLNFKSIPTQQEAYTRLPPYNILGTYKEAEYIGRNGLHLPVHQFLSKKDLDYMVQTIKGFF